MSGENDNRVSIEATNTTRTAVMSLGRRMERFEGEMTGLLTAAELRQLRQTVITPLGQAAGLVPLEVVNQPPIRMTQERWREAWRLIGQASRNWDAFGRELLSPARALSAPGRLAVERAQDMVNTAMSIAPNLGVAAAGGMVIAALAGLWVLSKIGGAMTGNR